MRNIHIILLFLFSLYFVSCHSQEKRNVMSKTEKQKSEIILKFYPSGGIYDVRYSISIIGDSLFVRKNPKCLNCPNEYIAQLSKDQINKIDTLVSAVKIKHQNADSVEDAWGVTLMINNQIVYEVNDFSFDLPPNEIKDLIDYLVILSAIKIELYGFS